MILSISAVTVPVGLYACGMLRQPFNSRQRCKGK
jgi:hypothetical protein